MKIKKIWVKRFRSINNIELDINTSNNFISICGPNNVGKTNVLRVLSLFFNPGSYIFKNDVPYLKQHTRGGSIATEITIYFEDPSCKIYEINRKIQILNGEINVKTEGFIWKDGIGKRKPKEALNEGDIRKFLEKFVFLFIPAINVSFPELINLIINDVYDIAFDKARFSGLKGKLKTSFDEYNNGLIEVLNQLAEEINPLFQEFNSNWAVEFRSTAEVNKFQDLISEDINFYIDDKAGFNNESKGSGLQKLGFILLHQKIIEKIAKSKHVIFCIDEPDAFIHRGL
ncbi:ATP-dependent nuclease [Neisseria perflava]|nr:AAA family ATPase [Neisseria perflava]MCP1659613.1 putative ATP-dependent endonuclease of OLD family [Neisseria perflava]